MMNEQIPWLKKLSVFLLMLASFTACSDEPNKLDELEQDKELPENKPERFQRRCRRVSLMES